MKLVELTTLRVVLDWGAMVMVDRTVSLLQAPFRRSSRGISIAVFPPFNRV
uniref:Uncharacterized protein n=1 Tax=Anopheles atroparvus TaxID=41427 RepID=A0AAG5DF20_ANOAO